MQAIESDLRLLAEDLLEIFNNSFDGIFVADKDGHTLMVNAGCERNYDLPASEMVGRHVSELDKMGYIRPVIAMRVIETKQRITSIQKTHRGKTIMATGIPLFDEKGDVRRVIINSRDTTELASLQEELARTRDHLAKVESEIAELRLNDFQYGDLVVRSAPMQRIFELAIRVAKSDATVLLTGESGVGKEVFARLIRKESHRHSGPFIKVNCAALPPSLIEAELFGYVGGAFTGASKNGKPGLIELADQGTLFLDEIGELPLDMQVKLLSVLQDRTVMRVGSTNLSHVDMRVISATNRNLVSLVEEKSFRSDLFYRLNVVPIEIPPLRERKDDVPALLLQSLANSNKQYQTRRTFAAPAMEMLTNYGWPGNVRELRNIVERLVVMAPNDTIGPNDLPSALHVSGKTAIRGTSLKEQLRAQEHAAIVEALNQFGSTRAAAARLGISQSSVVRKLRHE